ncbi:hypothetical protein NESM_000056800 [Novymonas esmeraldas]|uniref:Transmembrane protein n=1 Tax=Novymonas esmeraldas TaxID=1808958 RepID=A0AAW0F0N0_9TRYP
MRSTTSRSFRVVVAAATVGLGSPPSSADLSSCGVRRSSARSIFPSTISSSSSSSTGAVAVAHTFCSCRRVHIGHSSDVHRWRSAEKEEVHRQFRGGVKLGSHISKIREQQARERELIEQDKFTDWQLVFNYAAGSALLLIGLNVLLAVVEPNPSPTYVPYADPVASGQSGTHASGQSCDTARKDDQQGNTM